MKKDAIKIKNKNSISTLIALNVLTFLVFFVITIICVLNSFSIAKEKVINYTAKSNLDYSVNLKENNFYETSSLPKDMVYVASLIDNIPVTFNYDFNASDNVNVVFEYSVVGKLKITNPDDGKSYYEKTYTLIDSKTSSINDNNTFNINETVNIDYDTYNSIANNFKASYGVDSNSEFTLYLLVNKKSNNNDNVIVDGNDTITINIPLSEKSINISLDYKDINEQSSIISNSSIIIKNYVYIIAAVVSLILSLIFIIRSLRITNISKSKKSKHDKLVNKILREYDRLVVETTNLPDYEEKELIKIPTFTELLDVRDNIKLPIMHYVITKHQKSIFYIDYSNLLYIYVVKETELKK